MLKKLIVIFLATLFLASCAGRPDFDVRVQKPVAKTFLEVAELDGDPVIIAVYDFLDMTGQKKPGGNFASMSTAVTQGSYQLLIKALQDAGDGKWFRVVERASLPSLLQERKLIRSTRQMADGDKAEPLPPLLFAGAYITGGIVGYDSDTKSGGIGARILGIQANTKYRQDVVTVILRLVNVQTGEVVISTTIEKTIFSTGKGADIFKYFDADTMLLETEAGMARNEPVTFAVRKAIEAGVAEIIDQGAKKGLWKIKVAEVTSGFENQEDATIDIVQGGPEKIKTRAEYLAEKKAKKLALLEEKKAKKEKKLADAKAKKEALLAEKIAKKELIKAKKELKKAQKIELANYNKENNTKFKTYSVYQEYLKITAEKDAAILLAETQSRQLRKEIYQAKIDSEKAALEVIDESVITDTNTVTSNDD
jgi:curli production assembly/transport component CsgG